MIEKKTTVTSTVAVEKLFDNNEIQFARLICELENLGVFTGEIYEKIGYETDLNNSEINVLLERAQKVFDTSKSKTKGTLAKAMYVSSSGKQCMPGPDQSVESIVNLNDEPWLVETLVKDGKIVEEFKPEEIFDIISPNIGSLSKDKLRIFTGYCEVIDHIKYRQIVEFSKISTNYDFNTLLIPEMSMTENDEVYLLTGVKKSESGPTYVFRSFQSDTMCGEKELKLLSFTHNDFIYYLQEYPAYIFNKGFAVALR